MSALYRSPSWKVYPIHTGKTTHTTQLSAGVPERPIIGGVPQHTVYTQFCITELLYTYLLYLYLCKENTESRFTTISDSLHCQFFLVVIVVLRFFKLLNNIKEIVMCTETEM